MNDLPIMLRRFRRVMLRARLLEAAARGAIVGGIVAAGLMILLTLDWRGFSALDVFPVWILPAIFLPAGGLAGCCFAWLRGVSEFQAARRLDRRYDLKDHLGTASELLRAGDASSEAAFVYAQATRAGQTLPRRLDFWRCSRRTPAVLLLTVLLCGALLLLPGRADRLADRLLAADARQREAMKASLGRAAKQAAPETKQLLSDLARVIEVRDEAELRRILETLRRAGLDVYEILAANVPPEMAALKTSGGGEVGKTTPQRPDANLTQTNSTNLSSGGSVTTVHHPRYTADASEAASSAGIPIPAENEPIQVAWREALARAARADTGFPIPGRYCPILQGFIRR